VKARRAARILALNVLYEADSSHHAAGEILARQLNEYPAMPPEERDPAVFESLRDAELARYASELVAGVTAGQSAFDLQIAGVAKQFPVAQLSPIDRNLIRVALHELGAGKVPPKVVLNEAIEIAKLYGSEGSARFVNGVLGALIQAAPGKKA
jgi:transcription antitermination protein NusB